MKTSRYFIELTTEIVLGICLIFIAGFSLFSTFNLNPIGLDAKGNNPVLGEKTSPWTLLTGNNFIGNTLTDNAQLIKTKLILIPSEQTPESIFNIINVNNPLPRMQKYLLELFFTKEQYSNYQIIASINNKETIIFDGKGDQSMKDLVIELDANKSFNFILKLAAYGESDSGNLEMEFQISSLTLK